MDIKTLFSLIFHLFMLFIAIWSALAIFALFRYGQTKAFSLFITATYLALIISLYLRSLSVITNII